MREGIGRADQTLPNQIVSCQLTFAVEYLNHFESGIKICSQGREWGMWWAQGSMIQNFELFYS